MSIHVIVFVDSIYLLYHTVQYTKWSFYGILIMDVLIDTQTTIKLSLVKWIKLTYIFIHLFLHCQYHYNKPDDTCYQIKCDPEPNLNYAFVMDREWTFAVISCQNEFID